MIISFTGAPGSGKSTQIQFIMEELFKERDVLKLRVPNLIKKREEIRKYLKDDEVNRIDAFANESDACRNQGKLSPIELDNILFNVAERCLDDQKIILLDGAPRGIEQAESYSSREKLMENTTFIHLAFFDKAYEQSVSRQFNREVGYFGHEIARKNKQRFINKFETYRTTTVQGLEFLKGLNVPFIELDASLPKEKVSEKLAAQLMNKNQTEERTA